MYDNLFSLMFRILPIFLVTLTFTQSQVFAWSWKDAVDQAAIQNPGILARQQVTEISHLKYENAKTYLYPALKLVGQALEYQDYTESFRYKAYIGPELNWLLYQGGKVRSGISQTAALESQAQMNLRIFSVTTNSKLRQAYTQALYAKSYLDLARRIESRRGENVKFTKLRYESGLEYKWVYHSSDAKWKQAQLNVMEAEMNKKTSLVGLENILGPLPIQSVEEISEEDFYTLDTEYNLNDMVTNLPNNPTYLLQKTRMDESEAKINFQKADFYPQIGLRADFWGMSTDQNDFFPAWFTGLNLSMPLFQFNRERRDVKAAKHELQQRSHDLEQARLDIKQNLQESYQNYVIARQQVEISKLTVLAAQDRAKVVTNQYRSGLTSFLDWENSQDGWVNAEVDLLNNIRDYRIARAKLEEAEGVELSRQ